MVAGAVVSRKLTDLPVRAESEVINFTNDLIGGKLMAMGILPGSRVAVVRKAPFGGGWYVRADGSYLALRKAEAASIIVK